MDNENELYEPEIIGVTADDGQEILDMYPSCFESPITVAALDDNG